YRRYPKHPLLSILQEQIVYRMHASSRNNRRATYQFILLSLRHLPQVASQGNAKKLFASLRKHWEPLSFIEGDPAIAGNESQGHDVVAISWALWLAKPYVLIEIIDEQIKSQKPSTILICNALYCLIELNYWKLARQKLNEVIQKRSDLFEDQPKTYHLINILL